MEICHWLYQKYGPQKHLKSILLSKGVIPIRISRMYLSLLSLLSYAAVKLGQLMNRWEYVGVQMWNCCDFCFVFCTMSANVVEGSNRVLCSRALHPVSYSSVSATTNASGSHSALGRLWIIDCLPGHITSYIFCEKTRCCDMREHTVGNGSV